MTGQALQTNLKQSETQHWTGTVQVATELGVSTFSREHAGDLVLLDADADPAAGADASLRLRQADLARYAAHKCHLRFVLQDF